MGGQRSHKEGVLEEGSQGDDDERQTPVLIFFREEPSRDSQQGQAGVVCVCVCNLGNRGAY